MFDEFLALYLATPSVAKLKVLPSQEYKAFKDKVGLPVHLASVQEHLEFLPRYESFYPFFQEHKMFWIIPCDLPSGKIAGFVLRSFKGKAYRAFVPSGSPQVLFGFSSFSGFKKGKPIVLVESSKDQIYLSRIYPFVLSCLTDSISAELVDYLKELTDGVILALNNDEGGKTQTVRMRKAFIAKGVRVVEMMPSKKDWGDYYDFPFLERLARSQLTLALMKFGVKIES